MAVVELQRNKRQTFLATPCHLFSHKEEDMGEIRDPNTQICSMKIGPSNSKALLDTVTTEKEMVAPVTISE